MLKRLLLSVVVTLCMLLLVEGALSLATGGSLRSRARGAMPTTMTTTMPTTMPGGGDATAADAATMLRQPATDAERHDAGSSSKGVYQMHEDARVRYVLKSDAELPFVSSRTHTDHLGMRVRPGPPPAADALRIAVVGDSVAFSYGVDDDQTIAAHLERLLTDVRGPLARPVACYTVAIPSWNHRNALAFLTDHWDQVHADIVLYLPIPNDLGDTGALYESGKLRVEPDPFQSDPLLVVSRSLLAAIEGNIDAKTAGHALDISFLGPYALESDFSPESTRRYDDNALSIALMEDMLAARGARLLVVHTDQSQYTWHLDTRLQRLAPELPFLYLERFLPPEFTLGVDPHANAATCNARANWIAADLLARGWVDRGADLPLPEVPEPHTRLLSPQHTPEEVRGYSAESRDRMRETVLDEIDFITGKGLRQVIGGLNIDRTLRMHGLFLLKANGPNVLMELGPLPGRPDLYPLEVGVELGGVPAGTITVGAPESTVVSVPLPPSVTPGTIFEVKLLPVTWCVDAANDRSQIISLRPLRIACPAP